MITPGHYSWCYPSSVVSKYFCWFVLMGYPECDIYEEDDGTWFIIQFLNAPIIPHLTRWQMVLGPMRNVEKSYAFCEKYLRECDMNKRAFWDREEAKTKAVNDEHEALDRHKEEFVNHAYKAITKNEGLVQRIAKNGISEIDLTTLAKRVPKSETFKPAYRGVKVDVHDSSQSVHQAVDEGVS